MVVTGTSFTLQLWKCRAACFSKVQGASAFRVAANSWVFSYQRVHELAFHEEVFFALRLRVLDERVQGIDAPPLPGRQLSKHARSPRSNCDRQNPVWRPCKTLVSCCTETNDLSNRDYLSRWILKPRKTLSHRHFPPSSPLKTAIFQHFCALSRVFQPQIKAITLVFF